MKVRNSYFLLLFLLHHAVWAQTQVILPHQEFRPYFQVKKYPMGLDKDSMFTVLNDLETQQKMSWHKADSVLYFFALATTERHDEAFEILKRLKKLQPSNLDELHLLQYLYAYKRNTPELNRWLEYEVKHFGASEGYASLRKRIHQVDLLIFNNQWHFQDSLVFPELSDSNWKKLERGSKAYLNELIPLVETYDAALRNETKYEFRSNYALAEALYEFAIFLEKYVSVTDAFIVISVAKYYDKFNADINDRYREIRVKMNTRRYIFPSMREYFPKFQKGFFNINSIKKRQQREAKNDEHRQPNPEVLKIEAQEQGARINDTQVFWLRFGGILLLLLYVIFFLKVKTS